MLFYTVHYFSPLYESSEVCCMLTSHFEMWWSQLQFDVHKKTPMISVVVLQMFTVLHVFQEERRAVLPRYQPRPAMAVAAVPVSVAAIAPPVSSVAIMSPMAGPPIMRHAMHLGPPAAMLGGNMNMMRPPPMGLPPGKSTSDMVCHVTGSGSPQDRLVLG
jgi:hypothetical protein